MDDLELMEDLEAYPYEEEDAICRLSASFDNYRAKNFNDMTLEEYEENLKLFLEEARSLPLPPTVFVIFDDCCMLDWTFKENVIIKNDDDMRVLINNFENYISQITFAKGTVNTGFLWDDLFKKDIRNSTYRSVFGVCNSIVPINRKMKEIQPVCEDLEIRDFRSPMIQKPLESFGQLI